MKERDFRLAAGITSVIGLWVISNFALTRGQRNWTLRRDDNECQFPVDTGNGRMQNCSIEDNLEVHHISPQRWDGLDGIDKDNETDQPENLITLCKDEHHHGEVHPDMPPTFTDYGRQKEKGVKKPTSFCDTFRARNVLARAGVPYWETDYDEAFRAIAKERTAKMKEPFPQKNRRTTKNRESRPWYRGLFS